MMKTKTNIGFILFAVLFVTCGQVRAQVDLASIRQAWQAGDYSDVIGSLKQYFQNVSDADRNFEADFMMATSLSRVPEYHNVGCRYFLSMARMYGQGYSEIVDGRRVELQTTWNSECPPPPPQAGVHVAPITLPPKRGEVLADIPPSANSKLPKKKPDGPLPPKALSGISEGKSAVKLNPTPPVTNSENEDSVQILAISPPTNDGLPSNRPFAVTMRLHYRLVSADSVLLVPFLEQYASGDQCASKNHKTIASNDPSQIPIKRGEGEVSVVFKVDPDRKSNSSEFGSEGYVAPNASFWAGFDNQGRVIILQEMLWDSTKYCYRFAPR
jgi:hypothetical protein